MDIHVDPLGGWSGDMFVAALLDAFPDFWPPVLAAVAALGLGPESDCSLVPHDDGALTGHRFVVAAEQKSAPAAHDDHGHAHRAWSDIRRLIAGSTLQAGVKDHAIGIFALLAKAEAEVHGVAEDAVTFHEVGAVDSIVDIVAAAQIIELVGDGGWTSSALPLGSGRVRTAHGILPVPAPATALLLRGLNTIDDGIAGERVTPTGAALARYLLADHAPRPGPRRLKASGTGFGTRVLPGISNCLRVLAFEAEDETAEDVPSAYGHRELGVVTFEVDDQSAEDLAAGLDHIRARDGVFDVVQMVAFGKKGRMATQVQVLVAPAELKPAIAACFAETTTIGLRYHVVHGAALHRVAAEVAIEGRSLRVKMVERPGSQRTAKTEASDVAGEPGHAARARLRAEAEAAMLDRTGQSGPAPEEPRR